MRIENIKLNNFRIYRGVNEIAFNNKKGKNVSLIAGKNGFGKTTFLTSLIWGLYGNLMVQVEEKYKKDVRNVGGYNEYLSTLLNKSVLNEFQSGGQVSTKFEVEIQLVDVMIPSIPCKKVVIRRAYDFKTKKETLKILIDGQENELTKDVGYDVFINDFILPREIAKFFFFDAEKIVTLAEAKSKEELRSLSKAYSEVLGIKKYEDLKQNLNSLLTKLRRAGVSGTNKEKLEELLKTEHNLSGLIDHNESSIFELDEEIKLYKTRLDSIQEQLIREGNAMTLEELKELKSRRDGIKKNHEASKGELKKLMDIVPLVIAGPRLKELVSQVKKEMKLKSASLDKDALTQEFNDFGNEFSSGVSSLFEDKSLASQLREYFNKLARTRLEQLSYVNSDEILLDLDDETARTIIATYNYIQDSFKIQFEEIVKKEKEARQELGRVQKKIREGEARKDNPLAKKLRDDKLTLDEKVSASIKKKQELIEELGGLKTQLSSASKVRSEYDKNYKLQETDKRKYKVTQELLEKLHILTARIKEEKKYSLQKSIQLGLRKLMHKNDFVSSVDVRIEDDVMDIDLVDQNGKVIDKDTLSKGEQQLYATALLKALVDESGINFPVFIDSPLQKFDKEHSSNVIQQFYPSISEQVVLFPLLEKELSKTEYDQLMPNLNGVYLIANGTQGSSIEECQIKQLFTQFNKQNYVLAH